jgi:glycosyltransferase involved in cell wall biosynthesis
MTPAQPLVSICIPTYQGARWIREALASAQAQDYPSIEVVVSDDASTDGTVDIAASFDDERVRILRSERQVGMAANWNRGVRAARGEYLILLMQDDRLEPDCVSTMAALLDRHPTIGFVFSPRIIELHDPADPEAQRWQGRYASLHDRLEPLGALNEGRRLYDAMKLDCFRTNCFGEPSAVMVRRAALERVGLFNDRLRQLLDEEMWLRLAFFYDVGFVRKPLSTVHIHPASATSQNNRTGAAWLDWLWLLEGLKEHPEVRPTIDRRTELLIWARTLRAAIRRAFGGGSAGFRRRERDLREYVRFRRVRPRLRVHATLGEQERVEV